MASPKLAELERYRAYLRLLARLHLPHRLKGKLDPSDVIQETLAQAVRGWEQLRDQDSAVLAAWLRRILLNTMHNVVRSHGQECRDHDREVSLDAALEESAARLEYFLAAEQSSPVQKAERNEQFLLLAEAVERLPEAEREAIVLRHLQGRPLEEIAQRLDRTEAAVAGLLKRGLRRLREFLQVETRT